MSLMIQVLVLFTLLGCSLTATRAFTVTPSSSSFRTTRISILSTTKPTLHKVSANPIEDDRITEDNEDDDDDSFASAAALQSVTFSNLRSDQEPQLLCNFLMEIGACSTAITDADKGTDQERALFHEFDEASMTRTAVTVHVWDHCNVTAHFPKSVLSDGGLDWIMDLVQDAFPDLPKYNSVVQVENKDWVLHVQQSWNPILLDPFVLRFPWHTDELVQKVTNTDDDSTQEGKNFIEIELQGGTAFGTGEHPTTQLCLDWITRIVSKKDMMVMDYGAGSAILGMAACKLDPTLQAVGVDIDVDAVHIGNQNCEINNVNMINYLSDLVNIDHDDESKSVRMKAYFSSKKGDTAEVLPEDYRGQIYDACVANILAGPLVNLAPALAGLVKAGGVLGLSGIMSSQSEMILEAYEKFFDNVKVEEELDGWVLVTGVRKED